MYAGAEGRTRTSDIQNSLLRLLYVSSSTQTFCLSLYPLSYLCISVLTTLGNEPLLTRKLNRLWGAAESNRKQKICILFM